MLKATRGTGVVLPMFVWTMPTVSCVTSNPVKNCHPVNVISGGLPQRNNNPVFITFKCPLTLVILLKYISFKAIGKISSV
jgi:hypothetical protein